MYVRMIWGKLKRGSWDDYSRIYHEIVDGITKDTKGFRGRQLLRSTENADEGLSVTIWDNLDDLRAYDRSAGRQEATRKVEHLHTGDYWVRTFEVESESP